jgi:hypothetical protein
MKAVVSAAILVATVITATADLAITGSVSATVNSTAGKLMSAPAMRAPYASTLVVVTNASLSDDWSHLNVLDMNGSANTNRTSNSAGKNSCNMGIVKLWSSSTVDLQTYDNGPMLAIANVANGAKLRTASTWDNVLVGGINGYQAAAGSNTEAVIQYTGTSLGLLSVQKGCRAYTDYIEGAIVASRLDEYSRLYTKSGFKPLFCVSYLNNKANAHIETTGAAGAILHCPSGENNLITGNGTLSVGSTITNTHAYAMAFGARIQTTETNAVHARKFIATEDMTVAGRPVATLTYVPAQGDLSMGDFTAGP